MSENTQPKPQNDEVDLGQVFSYIEKSFKKIGELIAGLFKFATLLVKKTAVFLLFCLNIIISKKVFFGIALILGFVLAYILGHSFEKTYSSQMIIEQNFDTGNILKNQINSLNNLAIQADSLGLKKVLNIPIEKASKITGFSIKYNIDRNKELLEYASFVKQSDSINDLTFEEYLGNKNLENSRIQFISVQSIDPLVYTNLETPIFNTIVNNQYLNDLREKEIEDLKRKKATISLILKKSDTLQGNYFDLLEKYYKVDYGSNNNTPRSDINFNLDGDTKDKINTKEYELFNESNKLLKELDALEVIIEEKKDVIVVQKGFGSPVLVEKAFYESKFFFPVLFIIVVFLIFLFKELNFGKALKQYGTKEELFKLEK